MAHSCNHHHHHHHHGHDHGTTKLSWAVAVNMLLTAVQIVAGVLSGSLALVADALHNLSDAISLVIALVARKIGLKGADNSNTFGYKRAESVGALVNISTLFILGFYLGVEAVYRFFDPQPVQGWVMIAVASVAIVVNSLTAVLTFAMAKESINIKAAFVHNLIDALASVAVVGGGIAILYTGWLWIDPALTLLIGAYALWHGAKMIPDVLRILMQGVPAHMDVPAVLAAMGKVDKVKDVHHLHLWQLDEHKVHLEAHIMVNQADLAAMSAIKKAIKAMLHEQFHITHVTLEFEVPGEHDDHDHQHATGC